MELEPLTFFEIIIVILFTLLYFEMICKPLVFDGKRQDVIYIFGGQKIVSAESSRFIPLFKLYKIILLRQKTPNMPKI